MKDGIPAQNVKSSVELTTRISVLSDPAPGRTAEVALCCQRPSVFIYPRHQPASGCG